MPGKCELSSLFSATRKHDKNSEAMAIVYLYIHVHICTCLPSVSTLLYTHIHRKKDNTCTCTCRYEGIQQCPTVVHVPRDILSIVLIIILHVLITSIINI